MTRGRFRMVASAAMLSMLAMAPAMAQQATEYVAPPAPTYAQPMDDAESARMAARAFSIRKG